MQGCHDSPKFDWDPFTSSKLMSLMLASGKIEQSAPTAIAAGIRILSLYKIAEEWAQSIEYGLFNSDSKIVEETYNLLVQSGFKEEIAFSCINYLLASLIGQKHEMGAIFDSRRDSLSLIVTKALIAGYAGPPDQHLIEWLLDKGPQNDIGELRYHFSAFKRGSDSSLRTLVSHIIPFWKNMILDWSSSNFEDNISKLGFLFEKASLLNDHADFIAFRAMVMYQFGLSGDEDIACKLLAKAAFLGIQDAWRLIEEWSFSSGDLERLMRSLIDVGREQFCAPQQ